MQPGWGWAAAKARSKKGVSIPSQSIPAAKKEAARPRGGACAGAAIG
jgi:hypothetical protein